MLLDTAGETTQAEMQQVVKAPRVTKAEVSSSKQRTGGKDGRHNESGRQASDNSSKDKCIKQFVVSHCANDS